MWMFSLKLYMILCRTPTKYWVENLIFNSLFFTDESSFYVWTSQEFLPLVFQVSSQEPLFMKDDYFAFYSSVSVSLVSKPMLSFCKGQKCFIWFLTYSVWIMLCFCLPETLPILALITQRRRGVIFLYDLY